MSFLLKALGNVGSSILGRAKGFLQNTVSPIASRIGSLFSNAFGAAKNVLGNTAMQNLYDKGINAAMGGVNKFAYSDFLYRKSPMLAGHLQNAAQALKGRLDSGFYSMMQGGTMGGGGPQAPSSDGVEKMYQ